MERYPGHKARSIIVLIHTFLILDIKFSTPYHGASTVR